MHSVGALNGFCKILDIVKLHIVKTTITIYIAHPYGALDLNFFKCDALSLSRSELILSRVSQQISSHQEQFIQMLNEPVQEAGQEGGGGGVAEAGGGQMNYIQVTPQEKEAIERVKRLTQLLQVPRYYLPTRDIKYKILRHAQIILNTVCPIVAHVYLQNRVLI